MVFVHSVVRSSLVFSSLALPKTLSHPKPSLPFLSLKLNLKATSAASLSIVGRDRSNPPRPTIQRQPDLGSRPNWSVETSQLLKRLEWRRAFVNARVKWMRDPWLDFVIYDKLTGRSRGFGFVTMSSVHEVEAAEQQFNGYERLQRSLMVCQDKFETAKLHQIRTEAMTGLESCVDQSIQESISTLPPLVEISNIDVIQDLMLAKMKKSFC